MIKNIYILKDISKKSNPKNSLQGPMECKSLSTECERKIQKRIENKQGPRNHTAEHFSG